MLRTERVTSRRQLRAFTALPFRLYAGDPSWVPPLIGDLRKQLDPARNPFFTHASAAYFLALRGDRIVGRISAHTDERYNAFHAVDGVADRTGFWGFFECEDDGDAAVELFDRAAAWLAGRGMTSMVGPASFTLNDVAGLLVDGFDAPPVMLMTYNPPSYERLVEKAGGEPVQDLYAYRLDATADPPPEVVAFARTAEDEGFTFRTVDLRAFDREMAIVLDVYNHAWERNWGFCPFTEDEIRDHAKQLKPIIDPSLVFVVERDGAPAGFGLTLPDVNEVLLRGHGRLTPALAARLLWHAKRRRWDHARVFALGVKREFRRTGIGAHLYVDTLLAARRGGYRWGEMSWILESNHEMNAAIRRMGGTIYKTYRMYQRAL